MSYLGNWLQVLNQIDDDSTYKAAWGRAIIECVKEESYEIQNNLVVLYEYDIVKKMMKYYWNLHMYFRLNHFVPKKITRRVDAVKEKYYDNRQKSDMVWYDKVDSYLKQYPHDYEQLIKQFMTISNKGFAYQFLRVKRHKVDLYQLDTRRKVIIFERNQIEIIKRYIETLLNTIHYRWVSVLEKHNKVPNIVKKCEASMHDKLYNWNLNKERNTLLRYYHLEGAKDFFTGEMMQVSEIHTLSVLPYRFLYDCPLWNIVLTTKKQAKQYENKKPSRKIIDKLKERNLKLFDLLKDTRLQAKIELEDVITFDLLERYYNDLVGEYYDL
ncbi:MAG: hypothetical protein UMR38_04050 [Candidatus Izemoplasma sp.]|nr:hypothetical protein [Candidatus Izemoplasma sp.]